MASATSSAAAQEIMNASTGSAASPPVQPSRTPYPIFSATNFASIAAVPTTATVLGFADKIVLTISQSGRLSQWFQVPLDAAHPAYLEAKSTRDDDDDADDGLLPLTHLTPKCLLGASTPDRQAQGQLYAVQLASLLAMKNIRETRTVLVGLGFDEAEHTSDVFLETLQLVDSETEDEDDDLDITHAVSKQLRKPIVKAVPSGTPALELTDTATDSGDETDDLDNVKARPSAQAKPKSRTLKKDPSVIRLSSSPEAVPRKPIAPQKKQQREPPLSSPKKRRKITPDTPIRTPQTSAEPDFTDDEEQRRMNRDENRVRVRLEGGKEKVVITDDEDDNPYQRFKESKKRKLSKRGRKPKNAAADLAIDRENGFRSDEDQGIDCPLHLLLKKQTLAKDQKEKRKPLKDIYRFPPDSTISSDEDDDKLEDLEEKPQFPGASPCRDYKDIILDRSRGVIPASIAQWLRDYQIEGVRFMHNAFILNTGVILGDDMGLGKTVQVIAFLTAAFGKTGDARDARRMRKMRDERPKEWYPKVLIICPGTLISNWMRELDTWGWWQVFAYHGSKRAKEDALTAAQTGYLEIMITTYDTYRRDQAKINLVDWDAVVADECQKVKERRSGITEAMNVVNSLCRIGLTGTAIMNHYGELWNLLNWIRPGELGSYRDWQQDIETPLKIGQAHGATNAELAQARNTANDLLPKKSDRVVFCKLGALQQEVYENYLESDVVNLVKYSTDPCDCGSKKTRGKDGETLEKQEKDIEKLQIGLPDTWEKYYRRQHFENVMDPEFCGKWQVLQKLLAFWKENDDNSKVLIFSESKKLLKMLYLLLNNTHYNICYLDGEMPLEDRTAAVENFNTDPTQFVFLISTRAGGVGLNIVSANKVVVFDPSWNPSHDLQAQDRAYRIGQRRDVEVFRLVCAGTIEEMVYARQIYKQQQANIGYEASFERRYFTGVMKDSTRRGELFGLKNLFTFHQENVVLQEIVNKTNVAESKTGIAILNLPDADDPAETFADDTTAGDDDIISQIQAMVSSQDDGNGTTATGSGAPRTTKLDPIQAILASAGVEYTHENTEVIGTSKLEENISRKAVEVNEDPTMRAMTAFQEDVRGDARFQYGNVPAPVRVRQFNSLRKAFGYTFEENGRFALEVEGWRPEKRASALEKFYRSRRRVLAARGEMDEREAGPEQTPNQVITIDDTEDEEEVDDVDDEMDDEE
ncbi:hypothetical protein Dda_2532 [Drechslerella dactyloides]|uniref:Uncharacterized protein n=1 Tax=Drechslerella dactyloides TaxID=74499 RepID=A0AAD6IZP2_DREDA|nr:hypothetical protein Dda_2532 [Drechslerella dactyloides]